MYEELVKSANMSVILGISLTSEHSYLLKVINQQVYHQAYNQFIVSRLLAQILIFQMKVGCQSKLQ
jgi:hypothetical protein